MRTQHQALFPMNTNLQLFQDNPVAQTLWVTPRDAPFMRSVSEFPGAQS